MLPVSFCLFGAILTFGLMCAFSEEMEELEDEEGNVYNKKVYNDLKAQGSSYL